MAAAAASLDTRGSTFGLLRGAAKLDGNSNRQAAIRPQAAELGVGSHQPHHLLALLSRKPKQVTSFRYVDGAQTLCCVFGKHLIQRKKARVFSHRAPYEVPSGPLHRSLRSSAVRQNQRRQKLDKDKQNPTYLADLALSHRLVRQCKDQQQVVMLQSRQFY